MNFQDPYENYLGINNIYTVENIPTNDTEEEFQDIFTEGCDCVDICTIDGNCSCLKKYGINYNIQRNEDESEEDAYKKLNYTLDKSKYNYGLYECNLNCKCANNACGNRLVQYGPLKNLEIKDCSNKGKGLFTTEKILKGSFICEYAGEVLSRSEAIRRFKYNKENDLMNYILCVRENFGSQKYETFIDPSYLGNIGRYANHSCKPNCELIPVRVNNAVPKLCIFARKNIDINSELTFDYGDGSKPLADCNELNSKQCLCGEENCRKWMPYLPNIGD